MRRREKGRNRYVGTMLDLLTFLVLVGISLNLLSSLAFRFRNPGEPSIPSAAGESDRSLRSDPQREYSAASRALESAKEREAQLRRDRGRLLSVTGRTALPEPQRTSLEREELRRRIVTIRHENENLRGRLAVARQGAVLQESDRRPSDRSRAELERLRAEARRLQSELARLEEPTGEPPKPFGGTSLMRNDIEATPILVCLLNGRLLLLREPDFEWKEGWAEVDGEGVPVVWAQRKGRGADLAAALRSGSSFMELLEALDTQREYLSIFVDESSFAEFRLLRERLRERRIPFGWEPSTGDTLVFGSAGRRVSREFNGWSNR